MNFLGRIHLSSAITLLILLVFGSKKEDANKEQPSRPRPEVITSNLTKLTYSKDSSNVLRF